MCILMRLSTSGKPAEKSDRNPRYWTCKTLTDQLPPCKVRSRRRGTRGVKVRVCVEGGMGCKTYTPFESPRHAGADKTI